MTKENKIAVLVSNQESEIDFIHLANKFWKGRRQLVRNLVISAIIGILISFLCPKEYTASSTMVPQITDSKSKLGSLSGLAAIAGVSINTTGGNELVPSTYPQIISSVPFQLELMNTSLYFEEIHKTVTLFDYYTKIKHPNPLIKYTIGLPGVIIKAIKGTSESIYPQSSDSPYQLTEKQRDVQKIMAENIGMSINSQDGYITLFCSLPEAYAAAQLTKSTQALLQRYITEFKIKKVKANEDFIQQRYEETKQKYLQAQKELAVFRDRNKNVFSAVTRTEQEQLTGEYSLIYGVYSELAKKLEQAKIEVKEETPVFTIIKPVSVPTEKSKPNRPVIFVICVLLGLFFSFIWILTEDYFRNIKRKWKTIQLRELHEFEKN